MKKINLVEMLQGCSKRNGTAVYASNPDGQTTVKRQSRLMSQSGCSAVDVPMTSYGAPDEHPMSTRSVPDGRRWNSRGWKYVAMIFAVLVMSMANVGMAWADAASWKNNTMSPSSYFTLGSNTSAATNAQTIGGTSYTHSINMTSASGQSSNNTNGYYIRFTLTSASNVSVLFMANGGSRTIRICTGWSYGETTNATQISNGGTPTGGVKGTSSGVSNGSTGTLSVSNLAAGTYYICGSGSVSIFDISITTSSNWYLKGSFDSWKDGYNMAGSGTVSVTRTLSANTKYEFKLTDGTNWYGNGHKFGGTETNTVSTNTENCYLMTSEAGSYKFDYNTSTKALTITYPNSYTYYYANSSSWSKVYVYKYTTASSITGENAAWPGVEIASASYTCGGTDYYETTSDGYATLIFTNNNGSQTGNMTVASADDGKYVGGTGNSWSALPTYTISYDKGEGSGTMSSQTSISCGTDKATTSNTFTAPSGYQFAGWVANVDVKVGGSTKTAGMVLDDGVTIQEVGSNITLTAQWEEKTCPTSGTVYSASTNATGDISIASGASNLTLTTATHKTTVTGGTMSVYNGQGSAKNLITSSGFAMTNNNTYFRIDLECALQAGDVISVDVGKNAEERGVWITTATERPNSAPACALTATGTGSALATVTYTVTGSDAYHGNSTFYIYRATGNGTNFNNISITRTEACGATQPGAIGKGTLSGCTMRLTASGSPASNNSWYWQASASGTSTLESGATKDVTTPGTYYIRSYYSTGTCWSEAQSVTVSASDLTPAAPTGLTAASTTAKGTTFTVADAANTNNYDFYVSTSSTAPVAGTGATYTETSKTLTITDKVAGTTYYAWVRAVCGSYKSDWTALTGKTFTTSTVTVTHTLTNVTATSGATGANAAGGSDYTAVFAAVSGYSLPAPAITIDGNAAESGTDYTWTQGTGTVVIPANKITGNIVITIASAAAAPSSVAIGDNWLWFAGETMTLTATPTGGNGPVTYQWYKGGKADGNAIDGATSATYTKASCAYEDAGSYYCKVTCGGSASTWGQSGNAYDVKIPRLYVKTGRNDGVKEDYSNVDFTRVNETTATASISLGSNWDYCFNIADGCGHYYGNAGTMQYNNYGPWVTNVNNQDCGLRTTNGATYVFTINYSNWSQLTTTVTFPSSNQAADKVIYFDNNDRQWSNLHYRIGRGDHTQAAAMTLVPGTANLYKYTTVAYDNFAGWHIANNSGWTGSNTIYRTYTNGDQYSITYATAHEGGAVTESAVTVTPTTSRGNGSDVGINDNCEFYNYSLTTGMKRDHVTISQPSNGTITIYYTNENGVPCSRTAAVADMIEDLAHTVILTSITTSPNEGYDAGAITINGGAYSANYVVTGATTIAASFTPQVYSITYKDQGGSAFSGTHIDTPTAHPTSHTYNTTTNLNGATKTGYTFGGWYGNPECTGVAQTSIGATSITAGIILYAKWTPNQYSVSHSLSNVTKTSGATGANAATYGTNYTAVFAASSGYALPETITVTIGGSTKTAGTEYTWDQGTGTVTIGGSYITGDIVITVSAAGGCPTGGDIFTLNMTYSGSSAVKVAANSTLAMTATHGTATGGTVTFGNQNGSSNDKMQIKKPGIAYINGDDAYIRIDFSCPIKTGDVLTFTSDENKEISFTTTDTRSTSVKTSSKKWTVTKAFNDATTLYIWRGSSSSVNLHTINIVRPVTVTFDKNGGSSVSPSSATYDGTSSCVLAETSRTDYHLDGWNTRADGSGDDLGLPGEVYHLDDVTTSTTTVYAIWSAKSCASGTLYKFQVNTGLTNGGLPHQQEVYVKTSDFLSIMTGGYLKAYNSSSSSDYIAITDNSRICIGNSSSYLLVQLDCPLRAGDKIKSTVTTQTLYVTKADVSRTSTVTLPIAANNEQTIPKALVGATELKIWSGSSNGGKISYFEIIRSASTYNVTYDGNDQTSAAGTVPTDATNYAYNATVTTAAQGSLAKTNYTFGGWNTANDGTGTNTAAGSTFSITDNTTLYAKWTQAVTLDANTANHGSTDGSATAVWNATGLTGITHAKPAAGYKLLGYYSASSDGTKVLNSDGSFAATNVTGYITSGKWSRTSATTLYAEYESAGALTWNLIVNSDTTNLSTSTKTSAFTEISTTNMTNATLAGDLTYEKSKKSALTGKISTPASYDADDYVYVTFQVASGYKFTPSSIKVIAQPVTTGKDVKLSLTDGAYHSLVSSSATSISGGSTQTVTLAGDGTYFTGTVTLKIYCYGATDKYRLGTPITIEGEVEEACATMPSYTRMSYTTTTFAPGADASGSPITIVGGTNINTYQWKYNRVNDRTSGTTCGTNNASLTPLTDAGAAADVTRYYWCEMTNTECRITIKSPAVAITVAAAKSDATVVWTDPGSTPNYGGGGYTIKATVNEPEWDGNAADLVITAPAGINIYNVTSGTTSSQKWVQVNFDVQTSFDRTTYASNIPFTVSAAATASYNAISNDRNVSYSACTGAGEGSSYNIRMRKTVTKDGNYYHCANTDGWISPNISSSYSTGIAGTKMETDFDTVASSNTQYVWVRTYHADINKVRIYADFRADNMTVANVYKSTNYFSADSKYEVDYTAIYNGDEENDDLGDAAQGYVDIELDNVMAANDVLLVKFNDKKVRPLGAVITEGSAGSLNTYLRWSGGLADGATVAKNTTDAYFTYSASKITENTNSLGAITYSSSDPSVATVDATGKVAMVAAGTTTIKATLAASGCYKKAEISYTLNVTEVACEIAAGTLTLTSGTESKCSGDDVTLTLTGFESDATLQWKDGDTDINNGGNYTIGTDGTTLTTNQPGTYSVMVTKDCSVRSNRITISNKSTEVGAKRIVKNWYIKNGRLTPDIELWTLQNGAHLSSVAWSPDNATGLTASDFYESDGKVYLKGKEPSSNTSGKDIDYTLTLTVADDCGTPTAMSASGQLIYLHHQKNTDKHVLAFVVTGTEKGGFTEGITAAQTTSVELYNTIAANFDVLATNIYSTDDEQALKEYYSQFDILCVTDYPNTGTKGVNKKSYVDALGALVDIRPILTMEAFVAKLANWKAKGISGTPQSPTTRQYTMLLQCKDHEIFSGTELTKVGEGDETMYRVSMVDNTLEDYKTLDATYGSGTHEEKKNYNYGGKPALQGFTFTKEMLDDDLLPLGLIDDGSGNDLQVGIERQTEMEARLMVLGINSYAMERLTDDGQTVVVNALKYLMKKNSEDIADCSNTFVGGDDEEAVSTRYNWDVASHWSGNAVPDRTQKVRIVARCVIPANVKPHVTGVIIAPSGKYNHGANTANGSLTIAAGGALIVDGKVEAATAPYFTKTRATSSGDLAVLADADAQGALIFDNSEGETQATVQMYSPSYWEIMEGTNKKKSYWSYVAIPIQDAYVGEFFYGAVTYLYDETSGWIRKKIGSHFYAFDGIGLSLPEGHTETFYGPLAPTEDRTVTLTKTTSGGNGENLIGNSWTAPIQIANFEASDFGSATQNVMIYSTGRDGTQDDVRENAEYVTATVENDGNVSAGQWVSIPINVPSLDGYDGLKVIPAMQAFQVNTNSETSLTLNYDKLVRDVNIVSDNLTEKQHAPARRFAGAKKSLMSTMRVRVSGVKTRTDVWLLEDDRFSEAFDNGWEATYAECDDRSAQLYAQSEIGNMSFLAKPDIEGTVLGFAPSKDGNQYLFTFHYVGDEEYYLNDLKLTSSTLISNESSYLFTYETGDTNRFYISRQPLGGPAITTGVDEVREEAKPRKFIYNDKMYILFNGRVFDATGKAVK